MVQWLKEMTLTTARLAGKQYLNPHILECEIQCALPITALPGQYILLQIGDTWRPFSVAEIRPGNIVVLVIQPIKNTLAAQYFVSLTVGSSLVIQEPRGDITLPENSDILFIATGTGMVPLYTVANHLLETGYKHKIDIVFGVQTEDRLFYLEKLERLEAAYPNCRVIMTVSRPQLGWHGTEGRAIEYVTQHIDMYREREYVLCGRRETVAAQIKKLEKLGIPDTRIQFIE